MTTEIAIITAATITEEEEEATINIMAITSSNTETIMVVTTRGVNVTISHTQTPVAPKLRTDHSSKDLMILVRTMLKNVRDTITTTKGVNSNTSSNNIIIIIKAIINSNNMDTITITIRLPLNTNSLPMEQLKVSSSTAIHITNLPEEWSHHPIHTCSSSMAINTRCSSQTSNSMEASRIIIKAVDSGKRKTNGTTTTIGIEETIDPHHIEAVEVTITIRTLLKTDFKA